MHHVRVQAMRQGHSAYAGPRLCTQGEYLCLQLRAVFTPPWALLIQRLFHRLHDPPSWGRCPLQAVLSRWDRQLHTIKRQFGYTKVRYRGLKKNTLQLKTLFALSNLWMVRQQLLAAKA